LKKILPVLVLAGLAVGCSETQSAQNARVRQAHQEAGELLGQAALSYVPGETREVLQRQWRQDNQAKAKAVLDPILGEGTPGQQVITRRLMSDIEDSAARHQLSQAIARWTDLSTQSSLLLSYLVAVDRADSQLSSFSTDSTQLIASLRKQAEDIQKQGDVYRKDLQQVQAKVRDLAAKVEAAQKQSDQHRTQAARLREQAFAQSGAERLASYQKATEAEVKANKASAEAQSIEVELNIARSAAAVLERQVKLSDEAVADSQRYIKEATDSQADQAARRDKAQQEKQQAIDKLDAELGQLVTAYQQVMDEYFGPALARLDRSIELLQGALPLAADARSKREIQLDLLARKVSRLHLLSLQATAAADWASKLSVIHQTAADAKRPNGPMIPAKVTFYETTAQSAKNTRDQLVSQAQTTASEAGDLASEIRSQGSESDTINAQAQGLADLVNSYSRKISAVSKG